MVALFQAAFPRWPPVDITVSAIEHLRWKTHSHPLAERTNTVMEIDGEIVGAIVQFCRDVAVGDDMLVAHSGSDTAIHPRVQARGLMKRAQPYGDAHVQSQFDLSFNTASHHPRLVRRNARLGKQISFANELRILVRSFDLRTFAGVHGRSGGLRHLAGAAGDQAKRLVRRGPSAGHPEIEISTIERFDERFDQLWETARPGFAFIPDRRAAYLNWRYLDERGGLSRVRIAHRGDELLGYAVSKRSGELAQLVDLLVDPASPEVVAALASDAAALAKEQGVPQIACSLPLHHPYRQALLDCGFLDAGGDARLQYRPHGEQQRALAFLGEDANARIHLMRGDFDYV